jgi:hypothetical protein
MESPTSTEYREDVVSTGDNVPVSAALITLLFGFVTMYVTPPPKRNPFYLGRWKMLTVFK